MLSTDLELEAVMHNFSYFGDLEMTPIEPASASSKHCQGIHKCQIWGLPTNFWLQENLMKVNCPRLLFQSSC
ncbi:hypothetical protein CY35_13G021100 [Sphagnum magellanicum]|nr:hypothetical protein CY35_13G021100 [Sphagnum magellanicum]KAH9542692.1 hypothetical protein CY35_13G021100 [Sphagnum magellanicum]